MTRTVGALVLPMMILPKKSGLAVDRISTPLLLELSSIVRSDKPVALPTPTPADAERHELAGQRGDVAVEVDGRGFATDGDRPGGREGGRAVSSSGAERQSPVAFGQAVEDDAVRRLHAGKNMVRVDGRASRDGGAERGVVGDNEIAGEDRRAAGIGVGAGEGNAVSGIAAELHDEADIRRADDNRRCRSAGVDRRDPGEASVAVDRARGKRCIADDATLRDVAGKDEARQLRRGDRSRDIR